MKEQKEENLDLKAIIEGTENVVQMTLEELENSSYKEISDKNVIVETNPEQILTKYLSDKDNIERLDELAIQFNTLTRGKWFSVAELESKVLKDMKPYVSLYLDLLTLSKKAFSKKRGEVFVYKITLNKEQRKKLITNYIVELENSLKHFREELESLK